MDSKIREIEGELSARGLRVGIVAARFNDFIVDRLLAAAVATLLEHGAEAKDLLTVRVPGAFEIPVTVKRLAGSKRFDAIIALGCVIRGATPHFDYVAGEASHGLAALALEHELAFGFGVLTCDTLEQAIERAGSKSGNKGADAALTAIRMASVLRQLAS
jgi:6,7-dimethyl-8-ribityllumazine synthase